jgi:hypothetical protein
MKSIRVTTRAGQIIIVQKMRRWQLINGDLYLRHWIFRKVWLLLRPPVTSTLDNQDAEAVAEVVMADGRLGRVETIAMEQRNSSIVATPQDRAMARMHQMCDQAGSPRYLADSIIKQLRQEMVQNGFDTCRSRITRRDSFMARANVASGSPPPEAIRISLESGQAVTVFRFPLKPQLQEHLLSSVFADLNNLSVDPSDPWALYEKNGVVLKDFFDGTCYPATNAEFQQAKDEIHECILHPLLGCVDKTHVDGIEKNSLEPFMATSPGIRQHKREDSKSWFCLAFLPNLEMTSSAARRGQKGCKHTKSTAIRDYHRCFQALLQPLKDMQKKNL